MLGLHPLSDLPVLVVLGGCALATAGGRREELGAIRRGETKLAGHYYQQDF